MRIYQSTSRVPAVKLSVHPHVPRRDRRGARGAPKTVAASVVDTARARVAGSRRFRFFCTAGAAENAEDAACPLEHRWLRAATRVPSGRCLGSMGSEDRREAKAETR